MDMVQGVVLYVSLGLSAFSAFLLSQTICEKFLLLKVLSHHESGALGQKIGGRGIVVSLLVRFAKVMETTKAEKRGIWFLLSRKSVLKEDKRLVSRAGLEDCLDPAALPQLRVFVALLVSLFGVLFGFLFGPLLACLMFFCGFIGGYFSVDHVIKNEIVRRRAMCEKEIPNMLDVIALSVRAGTSFDMAFGMYGTRFNCLLSGFCQVAYAKYSQGALNREEALHGLAEELEIPVFSHFVENVLQAIHFGAPLAPALQMLGREVRKDYKASVSTRIAKMPVKMLIPTGTLILPAMLLLVMGPVALNITSGIM